MNTKGRLVHSENYALFYGLGEVEKLSKYDFVIVEPKGQKKEGIERLKAGGTLVLAYFSIMEINTWEKEFELLLDEDFLTIDNDRIINHNYGTFLLDLRSAKWQEFIYIKTEKLIKDVGYNGLFIDTIGDLELNIIPSVERQQLINAAVSILKRIKETFPHCILIQNNGLNEICLMTQPYLDGICWENPPVSQKAHLPWMLSVLDRLSRLEKKGIRILLLCEEDRTNIFKIIKSKIIIHRAKKVTKEHNFLLYIAPKQYVNSVRDLF